MVNTSKTFHDVDFFVHKLKHLHRVSTVQLNQRNRTLFWQNRKMRRLKMEEAELNFILYLKETYKLPHSEQCLINNMIDVQEMERKFSEEVSKPEDFVLYDSIINKQKSRITLDQREVTNLEKIEEALKKQIFIMENSLEVKTLEFGQVRTELAKIRNEFSCLNKRLKIFEDNFFSLDKQHNHLYSKMQTIVKSCVDMADKILQAKKQVDGMTELITLNEYNFNFELNETDRQHMQYCNFENFIAYISRDRDWYTLDNTLKKLEKELNIRHRQLKEDQRSIATIQEVSNHHDVKYIIQNFHLKEENNFALFR